MNLENFEKELKKLMAWFNKQLDDEQMTTFYKHVSYVPDQAFRDITERIVENGKPFPSNFPTPKAIKDMYRIWLAENPTKAAIVNKTKCEDCKGTGFLWLRISYTVHNSSQCCFRCANCDNWKDQIAAESMLSLDRKKAEMKGLEIVCP